MSDRALLQGVFLARGSSLPLPATRATWEARVKFGIILPSLVPCLICYLGLPRSKRLLISWLQSLSAVILEPKKIKSVGVSIVSPSICREVMGPDAMIPVFCYVEF